MKAVHFVADRKSLVVSFGLDINRKSRFLKHKTKLPAILILDKFIDLHDYGKRSLLHEGRNEFVLLPLVYRHFSRKFDYKTAVS